MDGDVDSDTSTSPTSMDSGGASTTSPLVLDDATATKRKHKKRKASKGRLKKLWRRAKDTALGITSRSEWIELIELQSAFERSVSSGNINNNACSGEYDDVKQVGEALVTIDRDCMLGHCP